MAVALGLALLLAARTATQESGSASTPKPPAVAAIALSIRSRAIQDSRCYLMNGGAVESFFISEDTPVGTVIGTLSVNGDPSGDGNISLSLQEKNAAVGIAPGSKNLTLLRALDREERRGPSNVYVNVRCDRRRTTDPSFIIPVSVRVWDVNDNAPVWLGAPYRVRLSELTAVGSRVLPALRASDADQPGPHATIHYSVLPGPNSEYFGFVNELDSVLVVKKPLDYETLPNFTVTLRASDNGTPPLFNDTILRVDVLDADDQNPKFSHDHYTTTIPDNAEEGTILETSPGPIVAQDQDVGINAPLYYSVSGERRDLVMVDRDTGRVAVTRKLLEAVDVPVTVVIKATQVDNADRYALATLWVGRRSAALSRPVRFSRRAFAARAREDAPPGTVLAVLHTEPSRASDTSPLQFYVSDRSFLEKFAINSAGEVLLRKPLDYETKDFYTYQVMVTDGITNDTASLNISVENVNEWEPRFRYPQYEFSVDEGAEGADAGGAGGGGGLLPVGRLDVHDGDAPDSVTLTLRGAHANLFYINSSGEMFLRAEALSALNASVLHVVATAVDSGAPPRQTSVPVLVHVGPSLLARGGGGGGGGAAGARGGVLLLFACALAVLALLVCALVAYIYRNKRSKAAAPSPPNGNKPPGLVSAHKPRAPAAPPAAAAHHAADGAGGGVGGVGGGGGGGGAAGTLASSGSLLSVSAGASTILANSSSSLDLRGDTLPSNGNNNGVNSGRQSARFPTKSKVAPAPPTHSPAHAHAHAHTPTHAHDAHDAGAGAGVGAGVALMSDHLRAGGGGRSGVAWPSHTIPARVKKLSWDDADHDDARDHHAAGKVGQWRSKRNPRRDQPHSSRPHEPHGLLLTSNPHHPFTNPLLPFHPRLTNPNHPVYIQHHPQAINHVLIHNHNLPNNCLPNVHPVQACNPVLIRNYALPNQSATSIRPQLKSKTNKNTKRSAKNTQNTNHPGINTGDPNLNQQQIPVNTNHPYSNNYHPQNPQIHPIEITNHHNTNTNHPQSNPSNVHSSGQLNFKTEIQINTNQSNSNTNHLLPRLVFNTSHPLPNMYHGHAGLSAVPPLPAGAPSAPRLSAVDPVAAALTRAKGPPPDYATIDPRKLRLRNLRPIFTRRGTHEEALSASSTSSLRSTTKRRDLKKKGIATR